MSRLSNKTAVKALLAGALALGISGAWTTVASAQPQPQQDQRTPKGWNYEIKDGKRVPKGNRVTNPDGSWREEVRQGNCTTIKQKSAAGEYKETRQCDSASGG